ncbi:putative methyltransferase PMT19 [Platanthera guangdongensis]|uniref:Methyltransferase n=1 Tax=Platanthera guangdongensis TaxID=2320717 RepID=A0ABR2LH58_9ASPA
MVWPSLSSSFLQNPSRKMLAFSSLTSLLCLLSYLIGINIFSLSSLLSPSSPSSHLQCPIPPPSNSSSSSSSPSLAFLPRHTASTLIPLPPERLPAIPFCSGNFTHYCPCHDPTRERLFTTTHFSQRERHCPSAVDRPSPCRVPRPSGYRAPIPWPESRGGVWFANVPFKKLSAYKADQNWVRIEGKKLVFPGGGTSFPHGVESYVRHISKLVPLKTGEVRTVLDIGCGVSSVVTHISCLIFRAFLQSEISKY